MGKRHATIRRFVIVAVGIVACAGLLVAVGHKVNQKAKANPDHYINIVKIYAEECPNGFTLNLRKIEEPTAGICVAYAETNGCFTDKDLYFVVQHALAHDGYVGGWLNTNDGHFYYDSVRLFDEDEMEEAMRFAIANGQQAIYVISTGEEIAVRQKEELPKAA